MYICIFHVYLCGSTNLHIHLGLLSCANVHKITKPGLATRITQIQQKKRIKEEQITIKLGKRIFFIIIFYFI